MKFVAFYRLIVFSFENKISCFKNLYFLISYAQNFTVSNKFLSHKIRTTKSVSHYKNIFLIHSNGRLLNISKREIHDSGHFYEHNESVIENTQSVKFFDRSVPVFLQFPCS